MITFNASGRSKLVFALLVVGAARVYAFSPRSRAIQVSVFPLSSFDVNTEVEGITSFESHELESRQRSFLDDGFVFGLEGSGLERPKGKVGEWYFVARILSSLQRTTFHLTGKSHHMSSSSGC